MSEFGQNLKNAVMKGIEAIGNTASSLASNTKQKVEEFNLSNQLKDLYAEIGEKVYTLSKQGTVFPGDLSDSIRRAAETEAELNRVREQKEENPEDETARKTECAPETGEEGKPYIQPEAAEYAAKDDNDVPVIRVEEEEEKPEQPDTAGCPLSSAINDLFENMPPVDKMVDKVNNSLDDLGDSLRKFSGEFDKQLNEFTDKMMGKDDQKD